MIINLSKVISYSKDALQSRAHMRAIMCDLYPGNTQEMNILLSVYESGIPKKIKKDQTITDVQYALYIKQIIDDYGMQKKYAVIGLNSWIDVFLGPGTSDTLSLHYFEKQNEREEKSDSNFAEVSKQIGRDFSNPTENDNNQKTTVVEVKDETIITASDYQFCKISFDSVEIIKFVGIDDGSISIPNYLDGCKVVSIGKEAFAECRYMTEIIIPEGVESIEDAAFSKCERLRKICFPSTLKNIGTRKKVSSRDRSIGMVQNGSFYKCGMLTSISIPDGVEYISVGAFAHCGSLSDVIIPSDITYIGNSAFAYTKVNNLRFPHSLKYINDYSFFGCDFREITLPKGVEQIGEGSFSHCHELVAINLPSSMRLIDNRAFEGCNRLRNIGLKEGIEVIGEKAFAGIDDLTEVLVPKSVNFIAPDAFDSKSNITLICYPGSKAIEVGRKNGFRMKSAT